jgi:2-dehydropantoate 2-reductase
MSIHYGVVGLGPVGAVFAALLGKAGHPVFVLEKNATRADYFMKNPMRIAGKLTAERPLGQVYTGMDEFIAAKPEVILICTKASQSKDLARQLKGMGVAKDTTFVCCQNGIDVEDLMSDVFGKSRVLRAVLNLGCNFVKVNEVWVEFCFHHVLSANPESGGMDERVCKDLVEAGLDFELRKDYREDVFRKAILNTALSTACALTRLTMRQAMSDPEIVRMVTEIVHESLMVAEAIKFPTLDRSYQEAALAYLRQGGDHKPSMLVDIEAERATENEFHAGAIFRYAQQYGIDVPVIQTLYYLTKNLEKSVVLNRYVSRGGPGSDL